MKIGLAQINPKVGDFNGNKQKILLALDALKEAEIVVFPELALTGYPPEDLLFNRDFLQQSQQALREIARSVRVIKWLFWEHREGRHGPLQ